MSALRLGLDVLLDEPAPLRHRRLGLLVNHASVSSRFVPAAAALRQAGLDVRVLYGPEHGLTGSAQDMEYVRSVARAPIPVVSLYGETFEDLSPKPEDLDGVDVVVCDLPDVGSRYYTFVWSTALMMKACAKRGIPVWVLDRPNPLGGFVVEGNLPDPALASFVGLYPTPVRHGMTPGEVARYVNAEFELGCELMVVPMHAGAEEAPRERIGEAVAWVQPSPNMPTPETTLVYPGGCLIEGTNMSEGRGTTRPFELVGAPWLDPEEAADAANALALPGVVFRPQLFKPGFQKHAGKLCGGVQIHVTGPAEFRPYEMGLRLLKALRDLDPASFRWRTETYEYRDDVPAIDLLAGTDTYRRLVDAGDPLDPWLTTFDADLALFAPARERSLLYRPGGPAVLLVVGAHESGKTTLMVSLVAALTAAGLRVGTIKQTHHEYETDLPGKDSFRHKAAGAEPAILVAGPRTAVHRRWASGPALDDLIRDELEGCDLVLVEGWKREDRPKIEVARAATGRAPVAAEDPRVIAVVTDRETPHAASVPRIPLDDGKAVAALVRRWLGR